MLGEIFADLVAEDIGAPHLLAVRPVAPHISAAVRSVQGPHFLKNCAKNGRDGFDICCRTGIEDRRVSSNVKLTLPNESFLLLCRPVAVSNVGPDFDSRSTIR